MLAVKPLSEAFLSKLVHLSFGLVGFQSVLLITLIQRAFRNSLSLISQSPRYVKGPDQRLGGFAFSFHFCQCNDLTDANEGHSV